MSKVTVGSPCLDEEVGPPLKPPAQQSLASPPLLLFQKTPASKGLPARLRPEALTGKGGLRQRL